jgi:hypothetical protein
MQSKITSVEPKGTWSNGQRTFNKYQVSFANGDSLGFLAVGDFKKNVGDVVKYEKNQHNENAAKLVYDSPMQQANERGNAPKDDVQKYIIRQSSLNRATDLYSKGGNWDEKQIIETARIFENYVYNG